MTYPTYDRTIDTRWRKPGDHWTAGYHPGVDFAVPTDSRVSAPAPSTIIFAGRYGGWGSAFGKHVIGETIIGGKRYRWIVAHLSATNVTKGQHVAAGQLLGASGATGNVTGPHVHFEVRDRSFAYGQDVDPQILLNYQPGEINKMDPANYGPGHVGPHVTWLGQRLLVHRFGWFYRNGPGPVWGEADRLNVRDFQLAQGWTGDDADGLPGSATLKLLAAERPFRIDWHRWKLTLPTGSPGSPREIRLPLLARYTDVNVRRILGTLQLTCPVTGVTTSGSGYPRNEFRELDPRTGKEIGWDSRVGRNGMRVVGSVTHLPGRKPDVAIAQIHGGRDDVMQVRVEGERMFVEVDGDEYGEPLDTAYQYGQSYTITIEATSAGIVVTYLKGSLRRTVTIARKTGTGWYFKAGNYCQANASNGSGYAQVVVEELDAWHEAIAA